MKKELKKRNLITISLKEVENIKGGTSSAEQMEAKRRQERRHKAILRP